MMTTVGYARVSSLGQDLAIRVRQAFQGEAVGGRRRETRTCGLP
jgi:DNA invertase Pin-like site-specific DNA recombinase